MTVARGGYTGTRFLKRTFNVSELMHPKEWDVGKEAAYSQIDVHFALVPRGWRASTSLTIISFRVSRLLNSVDC